MSSFSRLSLIPAVAVVALTLACQPSGDDANDTATTIANDSVPGAALAAIDSADIMRHIRVLAHDSLLGRAPGTVGEDKTVAYLESQFRAIGLQPGNTDGTFIQKVPLVGITVKGAPAMTFAKGGTTKTLK